MHENKRQEEKKVIFGYKTTTNVSERVKEIKIIRSIVSEAQKWEWDWRRRNGSKKCSFDFEKLHLALVAHKNLYMKIKQVVREAK